MEVTFDLLPRVIGRGDNSSTGFGIGDGRGHEVGKITDATFGVRRKRLGARRPDDQGTPDAAIDQYRRACGGTQPEGSKSLRKRARHADVAVHSGRPALSLDQRRDAVSLQWKLVTLGYHLLAVLVAGTHDDGCTVRPVLQHGDVVDAPSSG